MLDLQLQLNLAHNGGREEAAGDNALVLRGPTNAAVASREDEMRRVRQLRSFLFWIRCGVWKVGDGGDKI